jgi:transposase
MKTTKTKRMTTTCTLPEHTVGIDLGDRKSALCRMNAAGEVVERRTISTTQAFFEHYFRALPPSRVVLEVGTHSPWISRLLEELGHEVIVANPSKIRGRKGRRKSDKIDAEYLARLGRADPMLLYPVEHRGEQVQADLARLSSRDCLVKCRSLLINHVRGVVKSVGGRIPKCSSESFHRRAPVHLPAALEGALKHTLAEIESLTQRIREMDREVETRTEQEYPEARAMQQIAGVGPLTSLCFALVVEDPKRFPKRRSVGAYVGLVPDLQDSGDVESELSISKAGHEMCRRYLVQAAQYVLGPFGPDTDLRRWGLAMIGESKSKKVKKRAVIAVARKLSVLMLRLWVTGDRYQPLYNATLREAA